MGSTRITLVFFLIIAAGALALRLPLLDRRPMHGDEANQAVKTGQLLETSVYRYDPHDHHGPTLYYAALIPAFLRGERSLAELTEVSVRLVPAIFGAATILLLWGFRPLIGNAAVLIAALFTAVSPAFVYYSRYFIQESLLVFFTLGMLLAVMRYARVPHIAWALLAGICAGLMHATKETAALAIAAMVIAGAAAIPGRRRTGPALPARLNPAHTASALAAAALVSVTLYSSFFTYPRGPLDSVLTYFNFLNRAGGAGMHDKPCFYYLETLLFVHRAPGPWWSEALVVVLGAVGCALALLGRSVPGECLPYARYLAVYTIVLAAMYSAIPYKTPWSMLSFYHGLILMAALGANALWRASRNMPARIILAALMAIGLGHLLLQTYRANYDLPADPRNPYVYAHTSAAHLQLIETINRLADTSGDSDALRIDIIQPDRDYWPLPWYLRGYDQVGYWDVIPDALDADLMIVAPALYDDVVERLHDPYMTITGGLRPGVLRAVLIRQSLWDAYIETRR